ncbi:hypothetical protein [Sabulicella glaciei]|uniref:Uncharacterized protein n=1 Tax=Sabulicella glaciei TaxID=2984948 RepID=A0ABT3P1N6_9PROT|nr:hypothetical protein [Roseococcus sp. MDT2-1-1]MCW8088330.1 hypothetical protein [Roseococcus sp. MDT2-1-1]
MMSIVVKDVPRCRAIKGECVGHVRWCEALAGIADEAEAIRSRPYRDLRALRGLYFSVRDLERRRGLIEAWRSLEQSERDLCDIYLDWARRDLKEARAHSGWGFLTLGAVIACVVTGQQACVLVCAMAGLILAFVFIRKAHESRIRDRAAAVQSIEDLVAAGEADTMALQARQELFSASEALTGEPDPCWRPEVGGVGAQATFRGHGRTGGCGSDLYPG